MRRVLFSLLMLCASGLSAQDPSVAIEKAIAELERDPQFKHASISLYIEDQKTGAIIFKRNEHIGLAPASCQKIVTSASALELLGKEYQYKTVIGIRGEIKEGILNGDVLIRGSGDPTLGSWRYNSTNEKKLLDLFSGALKTKGIVSIKGRILHNQDQWKQGIPDGWIWEDIGNYYGAGAYALNWRENQYDLILRSGKEIGSAVMVVKTDPELKGFRFISEVTAAIKGSGDQAVIYPPAGNSTIYVRGTIPIEENNFKISGSVPDPGFQLASRLMDQFGKTNEVSSFTSESNSSNIYEHSSPRLDSINYWFMKRSINLYGEALVKTIASARNRNPSTEEGVGVIRSFWAKNGVESSALKIVDGSGLSPANRLTTHSLVQILKYARKREWYNVFYNSLPEINGIKMKDGYISGVRSYAGYVKSKSGKDYVFGFIINNFDGSVSAVTSKMWKLLDLLK